VTRPTFARRAGALATAVATLFATGGPAFAQQVPPPVPGLTPGAAPAAQAPRNAPRAAAPARAPADEQVTINFVNADIQAVIKAVSEITGRNILIDPRVTGTVNIVAPTPVPRSSVFSILLSALRAQGFAAVGGDGTMVRIVPEAEAKFFPSVGDGRGGARGDQVVTQVFQLQHESAQQLVPILRPLVSPNNVINAFPGSNTLIVTDYAENLRRIARVIASVDQPNPGELISIKMQNAAAVDVAQTIARLIPEASAAVAPGTTPKLAVTVDPRSNSVLVRADNPTLVKRIRDLAASMDTPGTTAGNINVVYLKNAEATKLAETLRGILSGQTSQRSPTTGGFSQTAVPNAGIGGVQPGLGGQVPGQQPGGQQGGFGANMNMGGSFGQPGTGGIGQASTAFTAGGATVQAYPETNSLVIIAPDNVYNALRSVIDKLDARRAQIFVEALIIEVTSSKAAEFGIQWQDLSGINTGSTRVIGGTNFGGTGQNIVGIANNVASAGTGLNLGVVRGTINLGGTQFLNLAFLARALETETGVNILSTPNLVTLDNEEAKIIVGQNIPIVTGSFTLNTTGGTAGTNPFQTFDRRDVGLTLRVKPTVAEGGSVKLQIFQEVSSIFDRTNASGIITNKRAIESTVIVDDAQTIVLGGLISDDAQSRDNRVPILGSIPFLGSLFRYETRSRDKTNLMVFLRPVIMRDQDQSTNVTGDRYEYIRGMQQAQQPPQRAILPDLPPPDLPGVYERDARGIPRVIPPGAPRAGLQQGPRELDLRSRAQPSAPQAQPPAQQQFQAAPAPTAPAPVPVPDTAVAPPAAPPQAAVPVAPPPVAAPQVAPAPQPAPQAVAPAQPAPAAPAPPAAAAPTTTITPEQRAAAARQAAAASARATAPDGRVFEPRVPGSRGAAPAAAPEPALQPRGVYLPRDPTTGLPDAAPSTPR
jgi:general secretion pathway protein D